MWTLSQAVALARIVEQVCPAYGCHVALTGGTLYKDGDRKDCDLLFYRIRQVGDIDIDGLWEVLKAVGLVKLSGFGWCFKCEFLGKPVDCFFPEEQTGEYNPEAHR